MKVILQGTEDSEHIYAKFALAPDKTGVVEFISHEEISIDNAVQKGKWTERHLFQITLGDLTRLNGRFRRAYMNVGKTPVEPSKLSSDTRTATEG